MSLLQSWTGPDYLAEIYDELSPYYPLFYGGSEKALHDEGTQTEKLLAKIGLQTPGACLDCGCGAGIQALGLQQRGWSVTGIDLSAGLLSTASRLRDESGQTGPDYIRGDMRNLPDSFSSKFDLCISFGNCLANFLDETALGETFAGFHRALKPGGSIVIVSRDNETFTQERPREIDHFIRDVGQTRIVYTQVVDWIEDSTTYECHAYTIIHDRNNGPPKTIYSPMKMRAWLAPELKSVAHEAGFSDIRWLTPAEASYRNAVLVARRDRA